MADTTQLSAGIANASGGLGSGAVHDFSLINLFLEADWVVKFVMIALILASFWCWTIIFDKIFKMRRLQNQANQFEEAFWSGGSLEDLFDRIGNRPIEPLAAVFSAAMREWRRSAAKTPNPGATRGSLQQRIDRVMDVAMGREVERLEKYMPFLASVGSVAPFVGLFGTVWGIMNSFSSIAAQKNTSLAVVAPGIAEALAATALGLLAAIPAVLAYNKISNDLARYANRLDGFAGEFSAILSRQLDEKE